MLLSIGYLYMCFICVQVNMCDILRKKKAWFIAKIFPIWPWQQTWSKI